MQVLELLDELRGGMLRDVSTLTAGVPDQLWTDTRLIRYINDAEVQFARRTQVLRDATTSAVTRIPLVAGVSEYPIHASILSVMSVRYNTDATDLPKTNHNTLDTRAPAESLWFDVNNLSIVAPGRPRAHAMDQAFRTLRVYPAPTAAEAGNLLYLRVTRLPITPLTTTTQTPEVPAEYHLGMLEWAASLAMANHDADIADYIEGQIITPSEKHSTKFDKVVADAITDLKRNMFAPMQWDFANMSGVTYAR